MNPKNYTGIIIYRLLLLLTVASFLAANRVDTKRYSPYEMRAWEIKANEGYRSWWYRDGTFKTRSGKKLPSHSIGYGWNDLGGTRRSTIKKYTADGKVTMAEAWEITSNQIAAYGTLNPDPYRNLAMQLYSYNCGKITSGKSLGKCHGGINVKGKRCGHKCKLNGRNGHKCYNVRKAHNSRRDYELALWNHDWINLQIRTEENQRKVRQILQLNRR